MDILDHERKWLLGAGAEMIRELGVCDGASVIDFGCGVGRYSIPLSQVVGETGSVLAIDRDSDDLSVFRERMEEFSGPDCVDIVNSEDICLPFVDDDFADNIFVFDVLQYIENWHSLFRSFGRVLKRNGVIYVYPAVVPHPGAVDVEKMKREVIRSGYKCAGKKRFHMMHNKDLIYDEIHLFNRDE